MSKRVTVAVAGLLVVLPLAGCTSSKSHRASPPATTAPTRTITSNPDAGVVSASLTPEERNLPAAPAPEPVTVTELPLPPTAPSDAAGACSVSVNTHRTGCMSAAPDALFSGGYEPDGRELTATVVFAGAPAAPDPASAFTGSQLILVKTDGTTFPDGDAWKCLTCGMSSSNAVGATGDHSYPQAFPDGRRALWGSNVVDCGQYQLADARCTPAVIHIYPIRWNVTADGSGKGGNIRELRLSPDGVHIGWNHIVFSPQLGEFAYYGRLAFNSSPATGQSPRYDLTAVTLMYNQAAKYQQFTPDPSHPGHILFNPLGVSVGEFRGFTKDGRSVLYIGPDAESDNVDVFETDMTTGITRRVTRNPEYTDPLDVSPDDGWVVAMDTRGSGRMLFTSAMEGIPPLTDQVSAAIVSSIRNNGIRRFFQPWLIDQYGDRGTYQGQQLNAGPTTPGSPGDPNWNGMADPRWSPEGTAVAYWQALVTSPDCGGANPLPCPSSTEPGGRRTRLMVAKLTSRTPRPATPVTDVPDTIAWGTPYVPGSPNPVRYHLATGTYTLAGKVSGTAVARITDDTAGDAVSAVDVVYRNYSDDGIHTINGTESISGGGGIVQHVLWHSDLQLSGQQSGTKLTSEPAGFDLTIDAIKNYFQARGTLTTTLDGHVYRQPANNT